MADGGCTVTCLSRLKGSTGVQDIPGPPASVQAILSAHVVQAFLDYNLNLIPQAKWGEGAHAPWQCTPVRCVTKDYVTY